MYSLVASIVLYESNRDILVKTIKSFLNTPLLVKLVLIDNSPSNELISVYRNPRVDYIHTGKNLGFGKGHNIGIEKYIFHCEYYLILNPDVFFEAGVIERIYNHMNTNKSIGLLMPKIVSHKGEFQFMCKRNPNILDLALRFIPSRKIKFLFKSRMDSYTYKNEDLSTSILNVSFLSGCFMFFRCEVLKRLDGFDERFFMYFEDADITRRTLEISKSLYWPEVSISHHHAQGAHKNLRLFMIFIISMLKYKIKWIFK